MKLAADLPIRLAWASAEYAEAAVDLDPDFAGFAGHFPGAPVLPGMCQIDLVVRASALALDAPLDLVAVERARFVRRASPGDELQLHMHFWPTAEGATSVAADVTIDGAPSSEIRIVVARRVGVSASARP